MTDAIVWLRRDLRLADNPALDAAAANADKVTLVYIHAPQEEAPWEPGAASNWWLHHSLAALGKDIEKRGGRLLIRRGDSLAQLRSLASETGAAAVYWNRLYEPAVVERDRKVRDGLQELGIDVRDYRAALLFDPGQILNNSGTPYKVFTPFWRAALARLELTAPSPAPSRHSRGIRSCNRCVGRTRPVAGNRLGRRPPRGLDARRRCRARATC